MLIGRGWVILYVLQLPCFSQMGKDIKYISCFILSLSPSFDFSLIYNIVSCVSSGSSSSQRFPCACYSTFNLTV